MDCFFKYYHQFWKICNQVLLLSKELEHLLNFWFILKSFDFNKYDVSNQGNDLQFHVVVF